MFKRQQSIDWATNYLYQTHYTEILGINTICNNPWSCVSKIITNNGNYFLKETPTALSLEATTITLLKKLNIADHIPNLIAENKALNCFLMTECGNISLREIFKKKYQPSILYSGLTQYSHIQRVTESHIDLFLSCGIPDWRLNRLPKLYENLLTKEKILYDDGITKEELSFLKQSIEHCIEICEKLATFNINETLDHCDFHENNMLQNTISKKVTIIDWGETVIAHPFFSLNGCLWNILYHTKIKKNSKEYQMLCAHCVKPWIAEYDMTYLLTAFNLAYRLNSVYAALTYDRLYLATCDQSKTNPPLKKGLIVGCLRSFLDLLKLK